MTDNATIVRDVVIPADIIPEHHEAFSYFITEAVGMGSFDLSTEDGQRDATDEFHEAYCGEYDDPAHYAEELADELGLTGDGGNQWPFSCIDWERAARELQMGGDNIFCEAGYQTCYVFRSTW